MRRTRTSRNEDLIGEEYHGIRPAPGYPAQPDHTEKATLFSLLDAEKPHRRDAHRILRHVAGLVRVGALSRRIRIRYYFGVAKVERDQVEDYAARKGMSVAEVERWLVADPQLRSRLLQRHRGGVGAQSRRSASIGSSRAARRAG